MIFKDDIDYMAKSALDIGILIGIECKPKKCGGSMTGAFLLRHGTMITWESLTPSAPFCWRISEG